MPAFFSDFGNIVLNSFVFVQKIDVVEVGSPINILRNVSFGYYLKNVQPN